MKAKKSQSIFEFGLIFIAIAGLVVGIVRIWIWFNANYARRQQAYQKSRILAAGRQRPTGYTQSIDIGATPECPDCKYTPLDLTEDWVFKGIPSGTVTGAPLGDITLTDPQIICEKDCQGDPACKDQQGKFDPNCACYQKCLCLAQISPSLDVYKKQIQSICGLDENCQRCVYGECDTPAGCGQACSLRKNAQSMRDRAEECDDPWELCWWGTWGRTARELRKAARELDNTAAKLEKVARDLEQRSRDLDACCQKETAAEQKQCFDNLTPEGQANRTCQQQHDAALARCRLACRVNQFWSNLETCYERCELSADDIYNNCYASYLEQQCADKIKDLLVYYVDNNIQELKAAKQKIEGDLTKINRTINYCSHYYPQPYVGWNRPNPCYWDCYNRIRHELDLICSRNCCCRQGLPGAAGFKGRNCDSPQSNCDAECTTQENCPKCGLTKLAADLEKKKNKFIQSIQLYENLKVRLPECCKEDKTEAQNECIANNISAVEKSVQDIMEN